MNGRIPYEKLSDNELVLIFASYVVAVTRRGYQFPPERREFWIKELDSMSTWLDEQEQAKVVAS